MSASSLREDHAVSIRLDCAYHPCPQTPIHEFSSRPPIFTAFHPRADISPPDLTTLLRSCVPFLCQGRAAISRTIHHTCAGAMPQRQRPAGEKTSGLCRGRGQPPLPLAVCFSARFSPSDEKQKVPSFHLSRTPSEAFLAGDEAVTCQGSSSTFTHHRSATRPSFGLGFGLRVKSGISS